MYPKVDPKKNLHPKVYPSNWSIRFKNEAPEEIYSCSRFNADSRKSQLQSLIQNLTRTSEQALNLLGRWLKDPRALETPSGFMKIYLSRPKRFKASKTKNLTTFDLNFLAENDSLNLKENENHPLQRHSLPHLSKRGQLQSKVFNRLLSVSSPLTSRNAFCGSTVIDDFVSLPLVSCEPFAQKISKIFYQSLNHSSCQFKTQIFCLKNKCFLLKNDGLIRLTLNERKLDIDIDLEEGFNMDNILTTCLTKWGTKLVFFNIPDQSFYAFCCFSGEIEIIACLPDSEQDSGDLDIVLWMVPFETNSFLFSNEKGNLFILNAFSRCVHTIGFIGSSSVEVIKNILPYSRHSYIAFSKRSMYLLSFEKILNEPITNNTSNNYKLSKMSDKLAKKEIIWRGRLLNFCEISKVSKFLQSICYLDNIQYLKYYDCVIIIPKESRRIYILNFENGVTRLKFDVPFKIKQGICNEFLDQLILVMEIKGHTPGFSKYQLRIYDIWKLIESKLVCDPQR